MIIICVLIVIGMVTFAGTNLFVYTTTRDLIYDTYEDYDVTDNDCIIVLGAKVRADGTPSNMLEDRIITGINLYKNGASKKLLMSGDHGRKDYDEVNTMKQYAINEDVSSSDIFMDHAGFSTYETMYRAKEVFGAKKVVIVSQGYHLYRAVYIAKHLGLDATGVKSDLRGYGQKQNYREFREMLARSKDFFKVMLKPEPKYLGDRIELTQNGNVTNDK